ncbi:MAG: FAD-dependent thymidylate synthase [Planctomycetota bacterium]|jgi:thymidylate synthase (FAD)|nr:FAD-dependent thymidylate synthase [Planctomycetota bacterium]
MIILRQAVELVAATVNADRLIERIARVCYHSEDKMACDCADGYCDKCRARRDAFLGGLARRGHESVFEHAGATVKIVTDRGISHELVRHRLASYSQSSTRYVKYAAGLPVLAPVFAGDFERQAWEQAIAAAEKTYLAMLDRGVPAENARDVLPTCTATTLFMSANFREWRHVLRLRLAAGAHPKVRELSRSILDLLAPLCPVYFSSLAELSGPKTRAGNAFKEDRC